MGYDRKKMAEELAKRNRESESRKDDSGKFGKIFVDGTDAKFWKCKEGEHAVDIIPYMTGKQHPRLKPGVPDHVLDIFVHYGVGITEDAVVCMERTYGKPCPICQHQAQLQQEDGYDEKEVKKLYPKRRAIYNVIVRDTVQDENDGVQVWDSSHFLTEKNILAITRTRQGGRINFADPDNGKTVVFKREGTSAVTTKYLGFRFEDREVPIEDADLEEAYCLDELIVLPDYEELKKKFLEGVKAKGTDKADADDDRPERRRRDERRKAGDDDEGSARRRQRPSDDEDEQPSRRRRTADEDDDQKASEEVASRESRRRRMADEDEKKTVTRVEDDEEDAPRETRRRRRDEPVEDDSPACPHGLTFGNDYNSEAACDDCKAFRECGKAARSKAAEAATAPEEESAEEEKQAETEAPAEEAPPTRRRRRPVED